MRTPLIAGNWKMNLTVPEGVALAEQIRQRFGVQEDVEVAVCPAFTALYSVGQALRGSTIKLGAQNVFWKEKGAYTGQIAPAMLSSLHCDYVILGHSETRGRFGQSEIEAELLGYFSETNASLKKKLEAILPYGLRPVLCVGETLAERESHQTDAVIQQQLSETLQAIEPDELRDLVVAYEPVWAIGTGQVCEADEANRVCGLIRSTLAQLLHAELAEVVRVLYGGSVKASNANSLLKQPEIDGALVGGASLDPEEFLQIIHAARTRKG